MGSRPNNVGILAMEVYFPRTCVMQKDLEVHDRVGRGRYIIGLGQDSMAFCTDVEDVISMSLTVVHSLLEKYGLSPTRIGRLEVGSETLMDKIKSIKTFLMHIFKGFHNTDIEGADSTNACYGGTAALLNCINWVESSSWDGRYGLVVCADSAVYAEGPGRPIGGAGAVAMLVGEDAPIVLESKFKGSHMPPIYDIYKPELASEYPVIDGQFSVTTYLSTLESCYYGYCDKFQKWQGKPFSISDADYFAFQSPYNKLVQKSIAQLFFIDYSRDPRFVTEPARQKLAPFSTLPKDESYKCRDFEKVALQVTEPLYNAKVQPTTLLPKKVGNMFTASVYAALASLLHNKHDSLEGKRVMMFSYGSDLTATMFSLQLRNRGPPFSLSNFAKVMNISAKLNSKLEFTPEKLSETLKLMKEQVKDYETSKNCRLLDSGTYYLSEVDSMYRRFYAKYTGEEEEEEEEGEEEEKPSSCSMNGSLLVRPDHVPISLLEKSISKPSTSGSCSNQLFGDIFLNSLLTK